MNTTTVVVKEVIGFNSHIDLPGGEIVHLHLLKIIEREFSARVFFRRKAVMISPDDPDAERISYKLVITRTRVRLPYEVKNRRHRRIMRKRIGERFVEKISFGRSGEIKVVGLKQWVDNQGIISYLPQIIDELVCLVDELFENEE